MRYRIFILWHCFRQFWNENRIQLDNNTESGDQNKGSHILTRNPPGNWVILIISGQTDLVPE